MIINNFQEFVKYIKDNKLNVDDSINLIGQVLHVYFLNQYQTTDELLEALIKFWDKWGTVQEKPLFPDTKLDIEK